MCYRGVNCNRSVTISVCWGFVLIIASISVLLYPRKILLKLQCVPVRTAINAFDSNGCPQISNFEFTQLKPKQLGADWHRPFIYDSGHPLSVLYEDPSEHLQCLRVRLCQAIAVDQIKNSTSSIWFHTKLRKWSERGIDIHLKCVPKPNLELGQITTEDMVDRLSTLCYSTIMLTEMKLNSRYVFSFVCARRLSDNPLFVWAIVFFGIVTGLFSIVVGCKESIGPDRAVIVVRPNRRGRG